MLPRSVQWASRIRRYCAHRRSLQQRGQGTLAPCRKGRSPQQLGEAGETQNVRIGASVPTQVVAQIKPSVGGGNDDADGGKGAAAGLSDDRCEPVD